jgi:dolichol-phosphate mannosyltransferase
MENQLLSVIFSFRNEAEVIPELVKRLQTALAPLPLRREFIFVNDASTDASLEILVKLHQTTAPEIRIVNLSRRFGVTPGVLAGFRHAAGDAVVYMDCDLQDPPEVIPKLVEQWQEGADIVHTTRTARHGESAFKMALTRAAYKLINSMSDITLLENTGDFKLISRRAMTEILKLGEFDPFMRGLVSWVGFKQVQVFYERDARFAGEPKFSLWRSANPYKEFIRGLTLFSSMPLYFALFAGIFVSILSFIYLFFAVFASLLGHTAPVPWIALAMIFLGGTILFTIGILGIYVGKIHRDIKGRPNYIVSDKIGFDRPL